MKEADLSAGIAQAREWIEASNAVSVLTGAGISTDSGIPDFRGPKGIWTRDPDAEKMATIDHYMSSSDVRRRSWRMRSEAGGWHTAEPNEGHRALARLEQRGKLHTLITQNVDGLHLKAGNSRERVVEIHGTLQEYMCMSCGDRGLIEPVIERVRAGDEDPACKACGGILKTATVSFGQSLFAEDLRRAEIGARECDLMLAIGSTLAVHPAASVVPVARASGARVVILNADPTEMDDLADEVLRGAIGEILPQLI
jgi:NAD-dependent deacetylase